MYTGRVFQPTGRSPYRPSQEPYAGGPANIDPVCLGATSKVIGAPLALVPGTGQAWGAFRSQDCNTSDKWVGCAAGGAATLPAQECPSYGPSPSQPCVSCRSSAAADAILRRRPISDYSVALEARRPIGVLPGGVL